MKVQLNQEELQERMTAITKISYLESRNTATRKKPKHVFKVDT